ncbi:hypothetical protein A9179_14980 [Pseudomonas alcaligenes]|uniref:Guanylate cyclase domain-containing protein n=1 Tax=Aquipseudomonas alcaligenes TaxID=43263 RepID=A0ABR7S361_AQUAC|nr:hypothetical protein [Pseudomonas alcaligenes]MBC9251574.1 hypothetical protein [Pseudomonas alcaligenes]
MDQYVERYVAFIDILGFREHVKSLEIKPEKLEQLLTILDGLTVYPDFGQKVSGTSGFEDMFKATTFSDNIVISGALNPIGFAMVMTISSNLCLHLLSQGVLTRGGITQGKLIHSDHIVLGDGMIKAYELESKTAIYPRVILDPPIVTTANIAPPNPMWKAAQDHDGLYFLDYMPSAHLGDFSKKPDSHFLEKVRMEIEETLRGSDDLGVKAKAGWMARHLNKYVDILEWAPIPLE